MCVDPVGFEPTTFAVQKRCSTNWSYRPEIILMRARNRIRTCTARALNAVPPANWATRAWGGRATNRRASGRARTGYLRCTRAAHPLSCCAGVAAPRPGPASSAYVSSAGFEPAPSAPSTPCLYRWATRIGPAGNPGAGGTRAATGSRTPVSAMARRRTDRCATATNPRSPSKRGRASGGARTRDTRRTRTGPDPSGEGTAYRERGRRRQAPPAPAAWNGRRASNPLPRCGRPMCPPSSPRPHAGVAGIA
jgi:hypothetical protein